MRVAIVIVLIVLGGCTATPRVKSAIDLQATVENVQAALAAVNARVEEVDVQVAAIGAMQVGGGGDSVTAWIYALIAGAAVLYPVIIRPLRKRLFPGQDGGQ